MEFLLFLLLGAAAGLLAGLFGVGGGLIIVPVLVFAFTAQGFDVALLTHMAVGTSLASIIFTSMSSAYAHHKKGALNMAVVLPMAFGTIVGSALGGWTAEAISGPMLQKIIGVFALLMAVQIALDLRPKASGGLPGKAGLGAAGGVIGWAAAIFGIGGGSLSVPFLLWRGQTMQQAVAVSAACGLPIALSGAVTFAVIGAKSSGLPDWSLGYIYLPALLGIALLSVPFAKLGANLAHRLPQLLLKRLFALLLLCVGLKFLL